VDLRTLEEVGTEVVGKAKNLHTMQALMRKNRWITSGQFPVVVLVTNEDIFYGGNKDVEGRFARIPMGSIKSVRITGRWFWKTVEIEFVGDGGPSRVFLSPIVENDPLMRRDEENLVRLRRLIIEYAPLV
jgi:hypothetical protein